MRLDQLAKIIRVKVRSLQRELAEDSAVRSDIENMVQILTENNDALLELLDSQPCGERYAEDEAEECSDEEEAENEEVDTDEEMQEELLNLRDTENQKPTLSLQLSARAAVFSPAGLSATSHNHPLPAAQQHEPAHQPVENFQAATTNRRPKFSTSCMKLWTTP